MIESKALTKLNKKLDDIGEKLWKAGVKGGGGSGMDANTIPDAITRRLALGANDIRNTIILSMRNTPKDGRHYKRGKKFHVASSPGNPPAIDSGELLRSIIFDVRPMEVEIGDSGGGAYYEFLEEGTKKMDARPSLGPAVELHEKEIVDDVGKGVFAII